MTAAADLLMALSLRGVVIDGKWMLLTRLCPSVFAYKRSLIRGKDYHVMVIILVGLSSIKLSDRCGV
jgi:hypothetical protein